MDPFSLLLLGGAAALTWAGLRPSPPAGPFLYRRVCSWPDGWVATDLLSLSSLTTACTALRFPVPSNWAAALDANTSRFVLVTLEGGAAEFAILCVYRRIGAVWELDGCYGTAMNRAIRPDQAQHVEELSKLLAQDIGLVVAEQAKAIADPQLRYDFLRAAVRRPDLSALVTSNRVFGQVVAETAAEVRPDLLEAAEQRRTESWKAISQDMIVHELPLTATSLVPAGHR